MLFSSVIGLSDKSEILMKEPIILPQNGISEGKQYSSVYSIYVFPIKSGPPCAWQSPYCLSLVRSVPGLLVPPQLLPLRGLPAPARLAHQQRRPGRLPLLQDVLQQEVRAHHQVLGHRPQAHRHLHHQERRREEELPEVRQSGRGGGHTKKARGKTNRGVSCRQRLLSRVTSGSRRIS